MPDYLKGKIYKIINDELPDLVYYGSTTYHYLSKRIGNHRCDLQRENNKLSVKPLFEKGKPKIVLIEEFPCNSRKELHERERYYIENNDCVNKTIPCRTKHEWYLDNKEKILAKHREKLTCECGAVVQRVSMRKHMQSNKHFSNLNSIKVKQE